MCRGVHGGVCRGVYCVGVCRVCRGVSGCVEDCGWVWMSVDAL